jgi:hypothetical protein
MILKNFFNKFCKKFTLQEKWVNIIFDDYVYWVENDFTQMVEKLTGEKYRDMIFYTKRSSVENRYFWILSNRNRANSLKYSRIATIYINIHNLRDNIDNLTPQELTSKKMELVERIFKNHEDLYNRKN